MRKLQVRLLREDWQLSAQLLMMESLRGFLESCCSMGMGVGVGGCERERLCILTISVYLVPFKKRIRKPLQPYKMVSINYAILDFK